jgi:hypothetical protein
MRSFRFVLSLRLRSHLLTPTEFSMSSRLVVEEEARAAMYANIQASQELTPRCLLPNGKEKTAIG